jgi:exopolysaccharide biosynthesis polyprenyl glycosylphosphotransferase
MLRYPKLSRIYSVAADLLLVLLAYAVAVCLRNSALHGNYKPVGYLQFPELSLSIVIIWWSLIIFLELNESSLHSSLQQQVKAGLWSTVIGFLLLLSSSFLGRAYFPRSIIVSFAFTYLTFYVLQKFAVKNIRSRIGKVNKVPILIVGTGERALDFCNGIQEGEIQGYSVVGFLDANKARIGEKIAGNYRIIGSFERLRETLRDYQIEEVIIVLPPGDMGYMEKILSVIYEAGITSRIVFCPGIFKPGKAEVRAIGAYPAVSYSRLPDNEVALLLKRLIDILVSAVLLIVLWPLFLVIAVLIRLTSEGPVFYRWKVVGQNNRDFVGYKFRTMVDNADELKASLLAQNEMKGPAFKMKNDPRVTRIGRWLRKYSLDELPQLVSVLKGDMSLVGPRPPNRNELERFEFWQRRKISFRPGMTCLWQVNGRNRIRDFEHWCKLDLDYIDNWSLLLDLKILIRTTWVVIRGSGY